MGENGQELSQYLQGCGIMPDTAQTPNSYTLEISFNTSDSCKCRSIYLQLGELLVSMSISKVCLYIIANINHVIDNTDISYNEVGDNCTISCTDTNSNEKILMTALIASVTVLTVLLGIVILCWIRTYRTMKKKVLRALQTTATTAVPATVNR